MAWALSPTPNDVHGGAALRSRRWPHQRSTTQCQGAPKSYAKVLHNVGTKYDTVPGYMGAQSPPPTSEGGTLAATWFRSAIPWTPRAPEFDNSLPHIPRTSVIHLDRFLDGGGFTADSSLRPDLSVPRQWRALPWWSWLGGYGVHYIYSV
jgi:hypothetical protein